GAALQRHPAAAIHADESGLLSHDSAVAVSGGVSVHAGPATGGADPDCANALPIDDQHRAATPPQYNVGRYFRRLPRLAYGAVTRHQRPATRYLQSCRYGQRRLSFWTGGRSLPYGIVG